MPKRDDVLWFKTIFQQRIEQALIGTPLTVDLIAAIACQETGEIWPTLRRKQLGEEQLLALCVGDTLDADRGRKAFPKTKSDLVAVANGGEMFAIARHALVEMAAHIVAYRSVAAKPNKFCHGFGIFQRDLQFFREDPQYFLQSRYAKFEQTLALCVAELKRGLQKLGWQNRPLLKSMELAALGIAYNTGRFTPSKGLKQGYFDGSRYYGEAIFDYIRLSQTVARTGEVAPLEVASPGEAIVPPASPVGVTGPTFRVDTRISTLRLRSEPKISDPVTANVIGELPDGHPVRAVTGAAIDKFMEVETSLFGALLRGFAAIQYLVADAIQNPIPIVVPAPQQPQTGVVAVIMPRVAGTVTRREDVANAHSLNEPAQPGRHGSSADELRGDIARIIDWLAVDKPSHRRYQPRDGLTFCNIYCHDYCCLAGVYLPRVWWSSTSIVALSQGKTVRPLIGNTVYEMRANDLFRWLREFGPLFGWRQTGTLTKLQQEANQGAIGLIVARRKADGRSGHIVAVVPETDFNRAKRDTTGEVIVPLQSQAGTTNFRYRASKPDWWRGEQFADSAFWIHS